jgi:hypothetical protein
MESGPAAGCPEPLLTAAADIDCELQLPPPEPAEADVQDLPPLLPAITVYPPVRSSARIVSARVDRRTRVLHQGHRERHS